MLFGCGVTTAPILSYHTQGSRWLAFSWWQVTGFVLPGMAELETLQQQGLYFSNLANLIWPPTVGYICIAGILVLLVLLIKPIKPWTEDGLITGLGFGLITGLMMTFMFGMTGLVIALIIGCGLGLILERE